MLLQKGVFFVPQHQSAQRDNSQHSDADRCRPLHSAYIAAVSIGEHLRRICRPLSLLGSRIVQIKHRILPSLNPSKPIERRLPDCVIRCFTPVVCVVLFCSNVIYGEDMDNYGFAVEYNGKLLGYIAEESDYYTAVTLAADQLANAHTQYEVPNGHKLSAVTFDAAVPYLTPPALADEILHAAQITLTEAYGVYRNDVFLGVVDDPTPLRKALSEHISDFSNALTINTDAIFYTEELQFVQGLYAAEQKISVQHMANDLTTANTEIRTIVTDKESSVYTIGLQYTMSVEELYALNPDLTERIPKGTAVKVSVTEYPLPIAYTATLATVALTPYEVIEIPTAALPKGERKILSPGSSGEAAQTVSITYINGVETDRKVLTSVQLSEPVTETVLVGTYTAKPASSATKLYGSGEYAWPVNGGYISDPYISNRNHKGLDIAAPANTEIFAASGGVVTTAGWNSNGYGYYIVIDHGDGHETRYAHCNEILVNVGQNVTKGQLIGLVGSTGRSTGNHLHFEVLCNGSHRNPADYLRVNAD